MSVDVIPGTTFQSGDPRLPFDVRVVGDYDITADGQRLLV